MVQAAGHGLMVLTGGPGTGKTTTINTLISYFESEGSCPSCLGAPTGRAAKRMTEATGCEAKTLHRLLEISAVPENGADQRKLCKKCRKIRWRRTWSSSMRCRWWIFTSCIPFCWPSCREPDSSWWVTVNQLPSVGPGSVSERYHRVQMLPCGALKPDFSSGHGE